MTTPLGVLVIDGPWTKRPSLSWRASWPHRRHVVAIATTITLRNDARIGDSTVLTCPDLLDGGSERGFHSVPLLLGPLAHRLIHFLDQLRRVLLPGLLPLLQLGLFLCLRLRAASPEPLVVFHQIVTSKDRSLAIVDDESLPARQEV